MWPACLSLILMVSGNRLEPGSSLTRAWWAGSIFHLGVNNPDFITSRLGQQYHRCFVAFVFDGVMHFGDDFVTRWLQLISTFGHSEYLRETSLLFVSCWCYRCGQLFRVTMDRAWMIMARLGQSFRFVILPFCSRGCWWALQAVWSAVNFMA